MAKTVKTSTSGNKKTAPEKQTVLKPRVKKDLSNVNPELTDAFIQEVDEDVKNDNLKALWEKYGFAIIAFVVLAVSLTISFDQIKNWRIAQNQRHTEEYIAATQVQKDNPENTIAALQQISQNNQGIFSDFARLQIANVLLNQDKVEEALVALESIVNDKQVNDEVKHVALVKLATYKLDTMERSEFEQLLQPLLNENTSWTPIAQDLLAVSAIKNGDIDTARSIYENVLKIEDLPEGFKAKIQDMLSSISDM